MSKRPLILSISLYLCAVQCHSGIAVSGKRLPVENISLRDDSSAAGKIIFLTYKVAYDSLSRQYRFALVNKQFVAGHLGPDALSEKPVPEPNYFTCEIVGSRRTQYIREQDPLNREVEYPGDPNNEAALTRTVLKADSGELTLRFQYMDDMQTLTIYTLSSFSSNLKPIYRAKF